MPLLITIVLKADSRHYARDVLDQKSEKLDALNDLICAQI